MCKYSNIFIRERAKIYNAWLLFIISVVSYVIYFYLFIYV